MEIGTFSRLMCKFQIPKRKVTFIYKEIMERAALVHENCLLINVQLRQKGVLRMTPRCLVCGT